MEEKPIQLIVFNEQLVALTDKGRIMARTEEHEPYKVYWTEIKFNSN